MPDDCSACAGDGEIKNFKKVFDNSIGKRIMDGRKREM